LQDEETVVRWCAAKGIGRLTMRLPLLMAHDVIVAVIKDAFLSSAQLNQASDANFEVTSANDESGWHGGCLVLAELARRGLLLPLPLTSYSFLRRETFLPDSELVYGSVSHLALAVPLISFAMRFDIIRGQHSVGAHVRDAACYVCWAIARAYSPEVCVLIAFFCYIIEFTLYMQVLRPYMPALTNAMLLTACYDREINCRRAASAALQVHHHIFILCI
jgi:hypothetical protein